LHRTASFDVLCIEIHEGVLTVDNLKNSPKTGKTAGISLHKVMHRQKSNLSSDLDKFCRMIDVQDVITYANFSDDHIKNFRWQGIKLSFSIDSDHHPDNTCTTMLVCDHETNVYKTKSFGFSDPGLIFLYETSRELLLKICCTLKA